MNEHATLEAALVAALGDVPPFVEESEVAFRDRNNRQVKYGYTSLPYTTKVINEAFAKHGLAIVDTIDLAHNENGTWVMLSRNVVHAKSGDTRKFIYLHPADFKKMGGVMNSWGATLTTARRLTDYAFAHNHGGDEDDAARHPDEAQETPEVKRKEPNSPKWFDKDKFEKLLEKNGLTSAEFSQYCRDRGIKVGELGAMNAINSVMIDMNAAPGAKDGS